MTTKYTIDDKLAITFDVNGAAVVQPTWPDGTPFASKAEAESWADVFVGWLADDSAPQPGNTPSEPILSEADFVDSEAQEEFERVTAEQKAAHDEQAELNAVSLVEEIGPSDPIDIEALVASLEDVQDAEVVEED